MFRAVLQEPAGRAVFDKFKINATPTMMLLDGAGAEVDWAVGYRPPAGNVQKALDRMLSGADTFQSLSAIYAKDPKDAATVFKLARKYGDRYDEAKADAMYRQVMALDPEGKAGTFTHDSYKVTVPYTEFAEFAIARTAVNARPKLDLAPMKAFLAKHPQSSLTKQAYDVLEGHYGSRGSKEEAAAFFAEYAARFPADPMVLYGWLARIVRDKGPIDKAIELAAKIEEMTDFNPSPSVNQLLAQAYALKGDKAKAEEVYGPEFMKERVSGLAYNLVAYANYWIEQNANLESAAEMIETALKLQPENTYVLQQAAGAFAKTGNDDKALAVYGPAFAQKSWDDAMTLWQYASFWARQNKNLDDALAAVKRSIALMPGLNYLWNTLSLVYERMLNYPEAIKAAEKALETAPKEAKANYQRTIDRLKAAQNKK
jgi:tetratricopeptide (TPR) repeat protein